MPRSIEIVVHCWRYSRVLRWMILTHDWQREKLVVLAAPRGEDPLTDELEAECSSKWVSFIREPKRELFNRAIGRNWAARANVSDWVWFADADYFFGPNTLRTLASIDPGDGKLFFPREVLTHTRHDIGDRYIAEGPGSGIFDVHDFFPRQMHKAIGGIQIVPGHVAREHGYCDWPKMQRPVDGDLMADTRSDRAFRASLGTYGEPLNLPGVFRIRHSTSGLARNKGGVERFTGN